VLARAGDGTLALGVDSVIGHRTLLVTSPQGGAGGAPWLGGTASLGGGRDAPVVNLDRLLART
jgi:chemotaxis protein histidine kinase CheA